MPVRTLLHAFATFRVGGPQTRFASLVNQFGGDYRHIVMSMDGISDAIGMVNPEVQLELLPLPLKRGRNIPNVPLFRRVLRQVRPDLLVTSNWGSMEWALANLGGRIPHLHLEDGFGPDEAERQKLRRVLTRRLALYRSLVVVPSQRLYRIARDVWRLPAARLFHIPNGIDCERFNTAPDLAFAEAMGVASDVPVIGTVARLSPEKNLERLVEAFAKVLQQRRALLVIVGDGTMRPAIAARAATLGVADSVVFTGACRSPERLLPLFSVFAVSSDTEQMPLSVLEAMAAGRALAATDVGDIRYMLAEENRPFVVERSSDALAAAISVLLDDPGRAAAIGAANARRAQEMFDQRIMFAHYRRLFDGSAPVLADGSDRSDEK